MATLSVPRLRPSVQSTGRSVDFQDKGATVSPPNVDPKGKREGPRSEDNAGRIPRPSSRKTSEVNHRVPQSILPPDATAAGLASNNPTRCPRMRARLSLRTRSAAANRRPEFEALRNRKRDRQAREGAMLRSVHPEKRSYRQRTMRFSVC